MISFIIPTYNAEKTIKKTVESILAQDENDYEIIIVNDGSTDQTSKIINELRDNNKEKIKYFEKENTGVADTRNYAVKQANGDYIIFADSDDYISSTLLSDIKEYTEKKLDIIKWNPIFVDNNGNELGRNTSVAFDETTGQDAFNKLFGKDKLISTLWSYAIKKENLIEFPRGRYHEDFAVLPLIIASANSMVSLDKYEYYYVQSDNSIMRNKDKGKEKKKIEDMLYNYDNMINATKTMNISDYTKDNIKIFATNSLLVIIPEISNENRQYLKKELHKRKVYKNIKMRNLKQFLKKIILFIKY